MELAKRLFAHYERSLLLQTPLMPEPEMRQNAAEFNQLFDCRSEIGEGTLEILQKAWQAARACLVETTGDEAPAPLIGV